MRIFVTAAGGTEKALKEELRELGYRHEFIEETTKALILTVRGR